MEFRLWDVGTVMTNAKSMLRQYMTDADKSRQTQQHDNGTSSTSSLMWYELGLQPSWLVRRSIPSTPLPMSIQ